MLDIGIRNAIKYKGQFDKVPDLSWVLFGTHCKRADFSQVNVRELTTILLGYQNLVEDGYFMEDVIKAFISKKPVTSIEISNLKPKIVNQLLEDLEKFFFVSRGYCDPDLWKYNFFVSRYKTLPNIISFYSKNNFGTYDRFSDVAGAFLLDLLENPSQEVASYCFKERLKKHNFIK